MTGRYLSVSFTVLCFILAIFICHHSAHRLGAGRRLLPVAPAGASAIVTKLHAVPIAFEPNASVTDSDARGAVAAK